VVDGHSEDGTVEKARNFGARVIHQNGKGKGDALRQAFLESHDSEAIVMMDADGSMDPEEIPLFVKALEEGADVAKGSRFLHLGNSEDITPLRRVGNTILTGLTNFLFFTRYTDLCYGYMAFKKEALGRLNHCLKGKHFEIEAEICVKAKRIGLRVVEIPSIEHARKNGQSSLNTLRDGLSILKLLITESLEDSRFSKK
jgi:glycosyltransferase involved in cell wall biosynthesis